MIGYVSYKMVKRRMGCITWEITWDLPYKRGYTIWGGWLHHPSRYRQKSNESLLYSLQSSMHLASFVMRCCIAARWSGVIHAKMPYTIAQLQYFPLLAAEACSGWNRCPIFWYVALMRHDYHDYHYHLHAHNRAYPTKSESSQLQVSALKPDVSLAGLARKSNAHTPKPRTPCPFTSHACMSFGEV